MSKEIELHVESEEIRQKVWMLSLEQPTGAGVDINADIGIYSLYSKAYNKAKKVAEEIAQQIGVAPGSILTYKAGHSEGDSFASIEVTDQTSGRHVANFQITRWEVE